MNATTLKRMTWNRIGELTLAENSRKSGLYRSFTLEQAHRRLNREFTVSRETIDQVLSEQQQAGNIYSLNGSSVYIMDSSILGRKDAWEVASLITEATLLAEELRSLRVSNGLTQLQFAKIMNMGQTKISRLERAGWEAMTVDSHQDLWKRFVERATAVLRAAQSRLSRIDNVEDPAPVPEPQPAPEPEPASEPERRTLLLKIEALEAQLKTLELARWMQDEGREAVSSSICKLLPNEQHAEVIKEEVERMLQRISERLEEEVDKAVGHA